ncbi:L,D-transpeptidase family protein [Qipengyuania sp. YIM B01966]|uniref:L,D-transpeptidase family protein n=1 Tax=Qipengyuania sp. YIM B01966 TaxID=2778646 RepID=UPI001F221784|nr:L,D-transpeptidase family protein [Qipengyuania sp. YIM B01966]
MRVILALAPIALLAACGFNGTDRYAEEGQTSEAQADSNLADAMHSRDGETIENDIPDSEERPMMQAQVVLDRRGFGPGVIDGKMGMSTRNALEGFQEATGLTVTGELDEATTQALGEWKDIPATRVVTIPEDWGDYNYQKMPEDPADKAALDKLGYETLDERLAERFHTTVEVLKMLNPNGRPAGAPAAELDGGVTTTPTATASAASTPTARATASASPTASPTAGATGDAKAAALAEAPTSVFRPGQQIRVPNIGGDAIAEGSVEDDNWQRTLVELGVGSEQPEVAKVIVSKSKGTLRAYDADDKLIALFTVTSGSSKFPLPLGNWNIVGKAFNPPYSYDPEVLGKSGTDGKTHQFPAGPNSPVGVVWIDLSKEHYGIHGTPAPETIGRAESSGCVRLTNWDAARLAQMVSTKTKVEFIA